MRSLFALAALLVSTSVAQASDSAFNVKVYEGAERTSAIVNYARAHNVKAFCTSYLIGHRGSTTLTKCKGFKESQSADYEHIEVEFTSVRVNSEKQFNGVVEYSGPAGYTSHITNCELDARGFIGCVIVNN